ncbi:hypothetical protein GSI_12678 [Ganoderma sinense ZZ0214-1]|uniref:DUF6534 domain-containing protein n=1 Tax=Ganoderma sinense ZZ0214-1 TaxID=1077348 RepID=A0A2G8RTF3_9APHY|nr:hypothetical protein GSI_12678 [Ganoderma sinense ZZ0214-1]
MPSFATTGSPVSQHRIENLKIVFLGIIIHGVLFGMLCGQIGWYLTHYYRRDRKHLKFLVLLVLFLSICHFGLYVLTIFRVFVTMHSVVIPSQDVPWSASAQVLINACGVLAVHIFYLIRIWSFSKKVVVTVILSVLVFSTYGLGIFMYVEKYVNAYFVFYLYEPPPLSETTFTTEILDRIVTDQVALCAVLALTDICLTTTFVVLLIRAQKGGAQRSQRLVKKLVSYSVTSGALTCLCAIVALITILALPKLTVSIFLSYTAANLYASAFVANLNARDSMRARWAEVSSINVPDTLCEEPPDAGMPKTETLAQPTELEEARTALTSTPSSMHMLPERLDAGMEAPSPLKCTIPPLTLNSVGEPDLSPEDHLGGRTTPGAHIHFDEEDPPGGPGNAWTSADLGHTCRTPSWQRASTSTTGSTCVGSDTALDPEKSPF